MKNRNFSAQKHLSLQISPLKKLKTGIQIREKSNPQVSFAHINPLESENHKDV